VKQHVCVRACVGCCLAELTSSAPFPRGMVVFVHSFLPSFSFLPSYFFQFNIPN
jgi:hypothetical protein